MPLSIPSLDTSAQGDQRPPLAVSMPLGAPPLHPGPHPSLLAGNQPQNAQQIQHHQPYPQQMTSLPMPPPYLPQLQPPSNLPLLSHPHLPRPPPQLNPLGMPSNMPSSMPMASMPTSMPMPMPMPMPSQMGVQGAMNQMVPPFQQGHFMGVNPMQSGSAPPVGGIPSGLPNNQGPSNTNGTQMYPPGGEFNLPQAEPMPPMPGFNPYQPGNPNAMGMGTMLSSFSLPFGMPPPLPPGPPIHGQSTQ